MSDAGAPSMRAVELPAIGAPLRPSERPVSEPGAGAVRVRVAACGICGSDAFLQKGRFGDRTPIPVVPSHEVTGVVDAVGPGGTEVAPGDQVAIYYITTLPGARTSVGT